MMSEVLLESAVFQLTPTRTRCDLVVKANGKTEKIASGLVKPFLSHLKMAQEQIEKCGYSITLEPANGADVSWFTKGTVERFVRFVSTPEILERVNTIELEISQIEEAIAIQENDSLQLSTVEDYQARSGEYVGGSKCTSDADAAKAIVLYKPEAHPSEVNGPTTAPAPAENSKVQLLKVLETRKAVLQKEQGMAFARAAAADFNMENIAHLIAFAKSFGAARLLEACVKYKELWKRKHETGQWLEIGTAEVMSMQSEFPSINASGIMLSVDVGKHKEHGELPNGIDSTGKSNAEVGGGLSLNTDQDRRIPGDCQVPMGSNEYLNHQFPHPMFSPWPVHSPPGAPVFQPYPMHGAPYYQNYPVGGPYFPPAYASVEDPRFASQQRSRSKRHSMDSKGSNVESDSYDVDARSQEEDEYTSDFEKETPLRRESHGKSRSSRKQSKMVVIRNLNYITSNNHNDESGSGSEAETASSNSVTGGKGERTCERSSRSSKAKVNHTNATEVSETQNEAAAQTEESGSGNWQVFQSFLLRDDVDGVTNTDKGLFSGEREPPVKRWQNKKGVDPILPPERDPEDTLGRQMVEFNEIDGKLTRVYRYAEFNDDRFHVISKGSKDKSDVFVEQIECGPGSYKRRTSEDIMFYRQDKITSGNGSSDPFVENEYKHKGIMDKESSYNASDESFILPVRPNFSGQHGDNTRTAIHMDSECPSVHHEVDSKIKSQHGHEPDDLSLMPERGMETVSVGYDLALDYEVEVHIENSVVVDNEKNDNASVTKGGLKTVNKVSKSRVSQDSLEKRKMDALRKGRLSKPSPLAEAQARANKLRAFKADLQKARKEKEEEEIRRLEALRRERQRRIAARSSNSAESSSTLQQKRNQLPDNPGPSSHRGSKFSDSEPSSSSPLQKLDVRARLIGSNDSKKVLSGRSGIHKQAAENGLSQSVSSLPSTKKDANSIIPTVKTASLRRLSDPKASTIRSSSLRSTMSDAALKHVTPVLKGSRPASSLESASSSQFPKKYLSDEPHKKNTATNMNNPKSATLSEAKVRASKSLSNTAEKSPAIGVFVSAAHGSKHVTSVETVTKKTRERTALFNSVDDIGIVEKVVVLHEHVNAPLPVDVQQQEPECMAKMENESLGNFGVENDAVLEYAAIRALPTPIATCEVNDNSNKCQLDKQPTYHELSMDHSSDTKKSTGVSNKLCQVPYARATSLEDPCTRNVQYCELLPSISPESSSTAADTIKARISHPSDVSEEQIHESFEKPRGKESLKGFKRLLKFGRKSHGATSGEPSLEMDDRPGDDQMIISGSSNEVHLLKNLISQDDTHVGGNSTKGGKLIFSPLLHPLTLPEQDY